MKLNFTFLAATSLVVASLFSTNNMSAQTSVTVSVQSNSYTPSAVNINVGDTVIWTNIQGNHNVNGTTGTFPSNPASFGNAVAPAGWTYSHKFTVAGTYNYHCDPHAGFGMTGTVVVSGTTSIKEELSESSLSIYPQPATDALNITLSNVNLNKNTTVKVLDLMGKEVTSISNTSSSKMTFNTSNWSKAFYFVQLSNEGGIIETKKIVIQ